MSSIKEKILTIRSQNELTRTPEEERSGELLVGAAEKILSQSGFFDPSPRTFGVEAEFGLVHSDLKPVSEEVRNNVILSANKIAKEYGELWSFQPEMGASQIEANQETRAILSNGFSPWELLTLFKKLDDNLVRAAHENDVKVLSMGLHPTARLNNVERTSKERYQQVPNHHIKNRLSESFVLANEFGLDEEPDGSAVGLSQALQFNMTAESPKQGLDMLNWMMQMTPSMLAILANSTIAEGRMTGWVEPRNRIWNQTHQTSVGSRVLFPDGGFFEDVGSLFEHLGKFPLMLNPDSENAALAIATGTAWLTGKLKFLTDGELNLKKILVEFRPMSIQQTPEENTSATMLAIGRLLWSVQNHEPLMSFEQVKNNVDVAMENGLDGWFSVVVGDSDGWEVRNVDGRKMREIELEKAIQGLVAAGNGTREEIEIFFDNFLPKESPSKLLIDKLKEDGGIENKQVLKNSLIKVLSDSLVLK